MYDVIFKNGNVVDVKNEQILQADIAVKDGKIAGIGHFSGENVIDCTGKYITPGFIDAHVHIESSMATPMEFSKAVMPHGTTTVIADPHELVNVKGNEAMEYILDAAGDAPLGIYVMMPSSIPATPFETNGADFTAEDMKQWKDHPLVLGLGEVMCYPAVLSKEEQIMKKLELCKGMVIDGHAPGLSGEDLKAYVEAGVMTDHECTSFEEAKEKCLAGMKILVREGSAARNVENIVPGLVKEPEFIAHFMFCTDDKHLDTIENEGHISYNIKKSIQLGMNPISAVKMATYNAAKTYGLNDIGVLEEGKDADIVILDSLESVEVHSVYKQGRIVNTEFLTKEAKPVNESTQARERTQILMDMANQYNGMVIGTGDMSELALGWATYNGDHMSMYAVNCSVPKTLVRYLVLYYAETTENKKLSEVLMDVLDTPVSPELLPPVDGVISQKTEDLVGPYELHDFFLYYMLRFGFPKAKLYRMAKLTFDGVYDDETIKKWLDKFYWRFFSQQFKRSCLPDGPKVGSVAVSPRGDLRMPSDASPTAWL